MRLAFGVIGVCAGAAFFWLAGRVRARRMQELALSDDHFLAAALAILAVMFLGALSLSIDGPSDARHHVVRLIGIWASFGVLAYAIILWGWRHD